MEVDKRRCLMSFGMILIALITAAAVVTPVALSRMKDRTFADIADQR